MVAGAGVPRGMEIKLFLSRDAARFVFIPLFRRQADSRRPRAGSERTGVDLEVDRVRGPNEQRAVDQLERQMGRPRRRPRGELRNRPRLIEPHRLGSSRPELKSHLFGRPAWPTISRRPQ